MTPGALPSVPIDYPALIIPLLCAGVLFAGTFFFLYIYKRGKDPLYLSMGVLALSAFVFVFSEGMILYFGGIIHNAALGRQFHRIEQSAGALFIFTIPYFIGHFLRLKDRMKIRNDRITRAGLAAAVIIIGTAYAAPDLFISMSTPHPEWFSFAGDFGRGKEGIFYFIRDGLLAVLFIYSFGMILRGLLVKRDIPYLIPMVTGFLIAFFQALDDIVYVHGNFHIGPFPNVQYSRFSLGLTLFILLSMAALTKRFIDEARQTSEALSTLEKTKKDLVYLAFHDPLTRLRNRKSFSERLEESIDVAERAKTENLRGLLIIDCGGYKDLRDRLGHDIGDWIITEVAARLKKIKRKSDLLFRTDADEFALILTGIKAETDCAIVAEKLTRNIRRSYVFGNHTLYLTTHVGIAVYPKDAADTPTLIRNAGSALVEAKAEGIDYQFYTSSLQHKALERINLLHALRSALEHDRFELHYQPQVNREGRVVGAEALIRWTHPEMGPVSPGRFIPLAEETGLIIPLGRWVLFQACAQACKWRDLGINLPVSINLSTQQMKDKNLTTLVENALRKNNMRPEDLHIEITESSLMENLDKNLETLHRIREMGCLFSIDDFGTGYSSLSYLKKLPVHTLKIDRSFIIGLPNDPQDCALVRAITGMARGLGLEIVAEGVDTLAQLDFLHRIDCEIIQGFLYSKPLPFEGFTSFARVPALPLEQ